MDEVARTGDGVVIAKTATPRSPKLVPHRLRQHRLDGVFKAKLFIAGDIISPSDVEWDALKWY
jgi:hypothetical protein